MPTLTKLELPQEVIPACPPTIQRVTQAAGALDQIALTQLCEGHAIAVGGTSLLRTEGETIPVVSLLTMKDGQLLGWSLSLDQPVPSKPAATYFDTEKHPLSDTAFPTATVSFVARVNADLLRPDASPDAIQQVVGFILPFIRHEGALRRIVW